MHHWKILLIGLQVVSISLLQLRMANADIYNSYGTLVPDGAGVNVAAGADLSNLNLWLANLPNVEASGVTFASSNLIGTNFIGANLPGANLRKANADFADFRNANLADANVSSASLGADLRGANLTSANLSNTSLYGAQLAGAELTNAVIKDASFIQSSGLTAAQLYSTASYKAHDLGAISLANPDNYNSEFDLSGWNFSGQRLSGADFRSATVTGANFANAEISGANFSGASLSLAQIQSTKSYRERSLAGINLANINLTGANFSQQNLSTSILSASLRNADLTNANLTGASLRGSDLTNADLTDANITQADFNGNSLWSALTAAQLYSTANYKQRNLAGLNLSENNLAEWNFSRQNLVRANFSSSILTGADFTEANIKEANFGKLNNVVGGTGISPEQLYVTASYQARDLSKTIFHRNDLSGGNFAAQTLVGTKFSWATLTDANFADANMERAEFYYATLINADLRRSNLVDAYFGKADLRGANLSDANLQNANFDSADLAGANLTGADIRGAVLSNFFGRFSLAQLVTTASYHAKDLTGVTLDRIDLQEADFANFNLTDVNLSSAILVGANFSRARINGATVWLGSAQFNSQEMTAEQLYSTASYQARDLSRAVFRIDSLHGWNFAGQNLRNASFVDCNCAAVDFAGADVRGTNFSRSSHVRKVINSNQLYSTASYQTHDLTGINLSRNDLAGFDLSGQNLSRAQFSGAILAGTNFSGAQIGGAHFVNTTAGGFSAQQLYSTASYQSGDLVGLQFGGNNLSGWNLVGKNLAGASFIDGTQSELANANFTDATLTGAAIGRRLTGANFTRADLRDAFMPDYNSSGSLVGTDFTAADTRGLRSDPFERMTYFTGATTRNMIRPDGHIHGLSLNSRATLVVRNYKGDANYPDPNGNPQPVPIVIHREFTIDPTSTLTIVFDSETWGSTISFSSSIPVSLGGMVNFSFAAGVNLSSQIGRTFDVFDWTGVNPTGTFSISSPYVWDLSNLYTTGDVTLLAPIGVPGDFNNDGSVDSADYVGWRKGLGITYGPSAYQVWRAHFGQAIGGAGTSANAAVPEPCALMTLMFAAVGWCRTGRRAA